MPLSLQVQFNIILCAILSGIIIGTLFDFYRIVRGLNVPKIIIAIEDILFFILCGIIIFVFLLYSGYAYFGAYVYIFIILSAIVYFRFFSNIFYKFQKKILSVIEQICRIVVKNIFYPIRLFFDKISTKK